MSDGQDTTQPGPKSQADRDPLDQEIPAPDILEALREFRASGLAGLKAANDVSKSLRILITADFALARSAFGRTLAFMGTAIAFGASTWLLLMATLIVTLTRTLGWSWTSALLVTSVLSVVATGLAGWKAVSYFEYTRMQATRRQLARLGVGELAELMPDADSHESTEAAAERVADVTTENPAPVKKGLGVDVTPP